MLSIYSEGCAAVVGVCKRESDEKCVNNSTASRDCGCPWERALTTLGKV